MAYWTHTSFGGDDSFDCDTTSTVTIQRGKKYTARITCSQRPRVVAGTGGIVSISLASRSGNNYYFAFTGVKAVPQVFTSITAVQQFSFVKLSNIPLNSTRSGQI